MLLLTSLSLASPRIYVAAIARALSMLASIAKTVKWLAPLRLASHEGVQRSGVLTLSAFHACTHDRPGGEGVNIQIVSRTVRMLHPVRTVQYPGIVLLVLCASECSNL